MRIASFEISRQDAMAMYLSLYALHETKDDPEGPLARILAWFKGENGVVFRKDKVRLGKDGDDFVALYYLDGVRYKIGKDGRAFVTGADADDMFEREEKDLQDFIDTLLLDNVLDGISESVLRGHIRVANTKYPNGNDEVHTRSITGIER